MASPSGGGGGSHKKKRWNSCVLKEIEPVVFESCLQRSKSVIFEGLSNEGLVMVSWRMEKNVSDYIASFDDAKMDW